MTAKKWPQPTDKFWFVKGTVNLDQRDEYLEIDFGYYEDWMSLDNCFRTKREAQQARARIAAELRRKTR